MIIRASRFRRVPAWYSRRVMRRVQAACAANPGFHRLVIDLPLVGQAEAAYLVDPEVEPEVRRLLSRVLILEPAETDDEPWPARL